MWIDECCERDPNAWETTNRLYECWKVWASAAGEPVGSRKRFSQHLDTRGFLRHRKSGARGFFGLKLHSRRDRYVT
jgi:putative DNA primase/helicase